MKKILLSILVCIFLLVGCNSEPKKTAADFAKEYEVSEDVKVKYLSTNQLDDVFKGTHVTLVTTNKYKEAVQVLCQEVAKYDGLYIYYLNSKDMKDHGVSMDINDIKDVQNFIAFVKESDIVDYINLDDFVFSDKENLAFIYDVILDSITRDLKPGCSDGC